MLSNCISYKYRIRARMLIIVETLQSSQADPKSRVASSIPFNQAAVPDLGGTQLTLQSLINCL